MSRAKNWQKLPCDGRGQSHDFVKFKPGKSICERRQGRFVPRANQASHAHVSELAGLHLVNVVHSVLPRTRVKTDVAAEGVLRSEERRVGKGCGSRRWRG